MGEPIQVGVFVVIEGRERDNSPCNRCGRPWNYGGWDVRIASRPTAYVVRNVDRGTALAIADEVMRWAPKSESIRSHFDAEESVQQVPGLWDWVHERAHGHTSNGFRQWQREHAS